MAEYKNYQSVLNAALGEYHARGFSLVEPDDHIIELFFQGETVARFTQDGATIEAIQQACFDELNRYRDDIILAG